MANNINVDNTIIKLNDQELPGNLISLSVDCEVLIDEKEIPGTSATAKQLKGFGDSEVSLEIRLFDMRESDMKIKMSKYEMLETYSKAFKKIDGVGNPIIYTLTNRHTNIRQVKKIVFKGLSSSEDSSGINLSIKFQEFSTKVAKQQKKEVKVYEKSKELQDAEKEKAKAKVKNDQNKEGKDKTDNAKKKDKK